MSWNRGDSTPKKVEKKRGSSSLVKGIVAGAIVVLGAVFAYLCLFDSTVAEPDEGSSVPVSNAKGTSKRVVEASALGGVTEAGGRNKGVRQSSLGEDEGGGQSEVDSAKDAVEDVNSQVEKKDNRTFTEHADQLLAMAMSVPEGVPGPPLPIPDDADELFLRAYKKPIVINEDDSDEVRGIKESVIACREEIKKLMDEGMSFSQIMRDHQETCNYNAKIYRECSEELDRIYASGDVEGAKQYRMKMNLALQQLGIKQLDLPDADAGARRRGRNK